VQKRQFSVGERELKMSSSLKNTFEKIKILEAEKKNLLAEIEGLKKIVDAKAVSLESEVVALRDEVKSLKTLVGPESSNQGKM
jgi:regulator of replication initiation timing